MDNFKYNCKCCDLQTNYISVWEKHIETEKHQSGGIKRKTRRDKKIDNLLKCDFCEYKHKNRYCLKSHILNNHSNNEERKSQFKFYCENCDIGTFLESKYNEHINGKNHKLLNIPSS